MPAPFATRKHQEPKEFKEKVVQVNRVSKKTKGGNKIGFSVLVVVGDKKGQVGVGLGKGPDVLSSIHKAVRRAKKHLIVVPLKGNTIPFPIKTKLGAATVLLKPAPEGTGVIAGGAVRAVVEAAGISNIVSKILGSSNQASNVYATFDALKSIRQIADTKGINLSKTPATSPKPSPSLKPLPPKKIASKTKDKPVVKKPANKKSSNNKKPKTTDSKD